MDVEKGNRHK